MNDNDHWKAELKRAWRERFPGKRENIEISSKVVLRGRTQPKLHLSATGVSNNMQTNEAAFEGWLLALRAWCDIPGATLSWDRPRHDCGHYQRFLFRVAHFERIIPWFEVDDNGELERATTVVASSLVINQGGAESRRASDSNSEAALERALLRWPGLPRALGVELVDHQFPVGLFRGDVTNATQVFPAGKAAVDLVGWNEHDRRFVLVELKKRGSEPIGAVSELFFYAMLLQDVSNGRFGVGGERGARVRVGADHLQRAEVLDALWLAPGHHTLLADGRIVGLLNEACAIAGDVVRFGRYRLDDSLGEGRFAIQKLEPCPRSP